MEQKHNEIRDLYNKLILDTQHLQQNEKEKNLEQNLKQNQLFI